VELLQRRQYSLAAALIKAVCGSHQLALAGLQHQR
jgi:hypothetical protein